MSDSWKVTNPDGESATLEDGFSYAGPPSATVSQSVMVGGPVLSDESGNDPVTFTVHADVEGTRLYFCCDGCRSTYLASVSP